MASIRFELSGKTDVKKIYIRVTIKRGVQPRANTGFTTTLKNWSEATNMPIQRDADLKNFFSQLADFKNNLFRRVNEAELNGDIIDKNWLHEQIDLIKGKKKLTDPDRLINQFQDYINALPYNRSKSNKKPVSKATIKKYITLKKKVEAFEIFRKKHVFVKDVDLKFREELISYFANEEELSDNTIGRYISVIKTICNYAKINGIVVNPQIDAFKGFTTEAYKTHLTFEELEMIEKAPFLTKGKENAKDWLIIGCHIGQRVNDLLGLTKDNITIKNGLPMITLTQQKTGIQVGIPISPKVKEILDKNGGNFPRKISPQTFNEHIKEIAKMAGINKLMLGSVNQTIKINGEKVNRKKVDTYEKWELVTSHICRRSFATNYYGQMPTPFIIAITGHSSESQFLEYVGEPPIDQAQHIADYFNMIYQRQINKPAMIIKKAN